MRNVQPFLEEIESEWRDEREVVESIAARFGCETSDVSDDAYAVFAELDLQAFVVREGWKEIQSISMDNENADVWTDTTSEDDDSSPLGDFCARHGIPADLHIDLTDACTERCVHCYVPRDQHDFLPYEMVEKVLREFRVMNGLTVHLTGGEAMLHPDFERICRLTEFVM